MPSWGIHLVTANEILKRIKVSDKNAFLIGNFMPDAEKHVIKDFSFFSLYKISHYAELQDINRKIEVLPNSIKFVEKYKNKINNPLVLGYLTHLLTDYYWNKITDVRYTVIDENGNFKAIKLNNGKQIEADRNIRRSMKHNDFYLFENKLVREYKIDLPEYKENLLEYVLDLEEVQHNKEDFYKIVNFLNNKYRNVKEELVGEYKLYNKEQMQIDFNSSIDFIIDFLIKNKLI